MRAAVDRPGRRRELRGLGRAGHPRAPDPPVRHRHRPAAARSIPRSTPSKRSSRSRTRPWPSCGFRSPGLRAGHYLCFFGMHVLTPAVFELLEELVRDDVRELGQIQLTTALDSLARSERYLALETRGCRYNLGRQVRRGRGPDRPGARGRRPRANPGAAAGIDRPSRTEHRQARISTDRESDT